MAQHPDTPETQPAPKPEPTPEIEPSPKEPTGPATEPSDPDVTPETADAEPDAAPDLVETMDAMVRDGRIDMDAYRGERMDDDIETGLGPAGMEDDFPRGAE